MNLELYILRIPQELKREIYSYVFGNHYVDFEKFCNVYNKVDEYYKSSKRSLYYEDKFPNVSLSEHWANFQISPCKYPEIKIQLWYQEYDLVNIVDYCITNWYPCAIVDMLKEYIIYNDEIKVRIKNLYGKHFYMDYYKNRGCRKEWFWNDESINMKGFYNDIIEILDDVETYEGSSISPSKNTYYFYRDLLMNYMSE